jgi:hypothetical protein
MAALSDTEILQKVKIGMGIATEYQDETLRIYIDDVKAFMVSAGVPSAVVSDSAAVGCIMRGVVDLWNYGSGAAEFSEYFRMRVTQLALQGVQEDA